MSTLKIGQATRSWEDEVSSGMIDGVSKLRKFGITDSLAAITESPTDADLTEVFELASATQRLYPWDLSDISGGEVMRYSSESPSDVGKTMLVYGQLPNSTYPDIGDIEIVEPVTIADTTAGGIALSNNFLHVTRVVIPESLSGSVLIYRGTALSGASEGWLPPVAETDRRAYVRVGRNQTQQCVYPVPAGKVLMFTRGIVGIRHGGAVGSADETASLSFRVMTRGASNARILKDTVDLFSSADSSYQSTLYFPEPVPAGAKVSIAVSTSTATFSYRATAYGYLQDESYFSNEFLASIGQPGY